MAHYVPYGRDNPQTVCSTGQPAKAILTLKICSQTRLSFSVILSDHIIIEKPIISKCSTCKNEIFQKMRKTYSSQP